MGWALFYKKKLDNNLDNVVVSIILMIHTFPGCKESSKNF